MEDPGKSRLKDAAVQSLRMEYGEIENRKPENRETVPLSEEESQRLSEKILLLPEEYQTILYCRYCFSMSCEQTEQILRIEQVHGKLSYCRKLLNTLMGPGKAVEEEVLRQASEAALSEYIKADVKLAKRKCFYRFRNALKELYGGIWIAMEDGSGKNSEKAAWWRKSLEDMWDEEKMIREPEYSPEFRRKLKDIPAARQTGKRLFWILNHVFLILLAAAFLFMAALAVNQTWRDKFFDWVITEILHGEFRDPSDQSAPVISLNGKDFKASGIPKGFFWRSLHGGTDSATAYFEGPENGYLWVILRLEGSAPPFDSRGAAVETCDLMGKTAYRWNHEDDRYLLWNKDSVQYRLVSNLSWEDLFQIAENIVPAETSSTGGFPVK